MADRLWWLVIEAEDVLAEKAGSNQE